MDTDGTCDDTNASTAVPRMVVGDEHKHDFRIINRKYIVLAMKNDICLSRSIQLFKEKKKHIPTEQYDIEQ